MFLDAQPLEIPDLVGAAEAERDAVILLIAGAGPGGAVGRRAGVYMLEGDKRRTVTRDLRFSARGI